MKGKCFVRPPRFKKRMIMMSIGIVLQAFGLSLLINLRLGTDPCSSFTQGVTNLIPGLSFGTCQLLCNLAMFIFVIRYDLSRIGFGTIGNMVCLGYISDFFRWIWSIVLPTDFFDNIVVCLILLIPVLAVFCVGAATYMSTGLGSAPYDALPFILSEHNPKWSFKKIRMIWDILFMLGGLLLGGNVGAVTIALAFFLGPIISWIQRKVEAFIG